MKGRKIMKYVGLLVIIGCFVACGSGAKEPNNPNTDDQVEAVAENAATPAEPAEPAMTACASDADCVPASCCHAKACVLKSEAPKNCKEMMCTAECREGTMDCGKGSCGCKDGACVVNWN